MILLGEAYFSIPILHKSLFILSRWAWAAHRLAWCSWNRWDSNSWLISWRKISWRRFSQFLASISASASYSFCCASLSSDGRVNFPFKDFLEIFSVSQGMHDVLISISLPFHSTENGWNNRFSIHIGTSCLCARTTVNQLSPLFPGTRTWRSSKKVGTLLAAVCLLLLDALEPFGQTSHSSERRCTGYFYGHWTR